MSTSDIILPPGFELEQDEASGVKLPPGYQLERRTPTPEIKLPPGFELEQQTPMSTVKLPPSFQPEQSKKAPRIKLPPGFELEAKSHAEQPGRVAPRTEHLAEPQYQFHSADSGFQNTSNSPPPMARPKPVAPVTRTSSAFKAGQANRGDSDADTRKFFEDGYARFFDSDQAQTPGQNIPPNASSTIHWGDRSWANASPEVIARVHPSQADRSAPLSGSVVENPAQRPNAVSRFTDSMAQAMGVPPVMSDYWEGPKMAVTHPIESAKLLTEAAGQAEQDLVDKAYWYQHQTGFGNKAKGLAYGIYSLIPFAGSSLAHAGEQFEQRDLAGGFGTTFGVAGPSLIGAKGSVHEPSFGFRPGDSVVLPSGRPGTVQNVFPRMGVARVETERGVRTIGLSRLQRTDIPVLDAAQVDANTEIPTLQLHPGDQLVLKDGHRATFLYASPTNGVARVHLRDGQMQTMRLAEMQVVRPAAADQELVLARSPHYQQKINPSNEQIFRWNDSAPRRMNKREGPRWDFQRRTCGSIEFLLRGGDKQVWADGPITAEGLALDAKFVEKPKRSPFIKDSGLKYNIRAMINEDLEKEFSKYAAVIGDPNTPVVGLKVITNDRRAVPYLLGLMHKYRIPGRVVVK